MSNPHSHLHFLPSEILLHIGHHLDKHALFASIQTSTLLYNIYTPLLWRTITLDDTSDKQVHYEALQDRVEFVNDLTIKTFLPSYYTLTFPRLDSLSLLNDYSFICAPEFIRLNPTIKNLLILDRQSLPTKDFWEALYLEWHQPIALTVKDLNVTEKSAGAFWKACSRFKRLCLSLHAPCGSLPKKLIFPYVTHLDLKLDYLRDEPFSPEEQLAFVKACPNLVDLCWSLNHFEPPMLQFHEALIQKTWPWLTSLELRGSTHTDADLSIVMDSISPLRRLVLSECSMGVMTFTKLKERHFASFEVIDVASCREFTSAMAIEVLSRCPRLQEFSCPCIQLTDLINFPQQHGHHQKQQQHPFACQQHLRHLCTFVFKNESDPADKIMEAMKQLSTLTQLEHLSLCPGKFNLEHHVQAQYIQKISGGCLDMCLANGLGHLSSLKRLTCLEFGYSSPRMAIDEARWMIISWKRLKSVAGRFSHNSNDASYEDFTTLFAERDIVLLDISHDYKQ
ncbi:hypothetical protein FBU30_005227 [Linnemannia zychae]|nr:hypothetical protein FBU30_005227 [Linnemannia zychae]